jgi:multidrug efflux pump subunit AcrA (membrane-fusion protein)
VQPLTQVQVGAQVSGRITDVMVDFNSKVKKGTTNLTITASSGGVNKTATVALTIN